MNNINDNNFLIIISGPTASGKSDLSEQISEQVSTKRALFEIINADIGQFYTPFSIGTAKPDWRNKKTPHHLFDILNEPTDLTVIQYKELLFNKINEIWKKGKVPIIVGGSLFYLKSLFFPPKHVCPKQVSPKHVSAKQVSAEQSYSKRVIGKEPETSFAETIIYNKDKLWETLNKIDPVRAAQIHCNDIYRIERALDIWKKTGVKPSELKPEFDPFFNSMFIYMDLDKELLHKRINSRTKIMLDTGWIDEVKKFIGTEWENFFSIKGLIGYQKISDWIKAGEDKKTKDKLAEEIATQTRQYAKRQRIFWQSFKKQLEEASGKSNLFCKIKEIKSVNSNDLDSIKDDLKNYM